MGLFSKKTASTDANTAPAVGTEKHGRNNIMSRKERKHGKSRATYGDGTLNKRPKFGQWLKSTWPDILTMVIMGMLGLGVCDISKRYLKCKLVY